MTKSKKIYIGVAWPYVNGDIHIGHLASTFVPCDIFSRFQRISGNDVLMTSGADCHGTPVTMQADKEGTTPEEIVKKYYPRQVGLMKQYGITYSLWTRTTTQNHKEVVHKLFLDLLKNGYIEKGTSQQYYSETEKRFLPDRYVEGECPYCHAKEQRSDQCEACGRMLDQGELIAPYSKLTKSPVELKESEHYFFNLEKLQTELEKYIDSVKPSYRKWVHQETSGWLKEGLKSRAFTRDLDWGIPLPTDQIPEDMKLSSFEGKCIYVWYEALTGYLSSSIEWASGNSDPDILKTVDKGQSNQWEEWWQNPDAQHYYFMGQDNLVFHTIIWPTMLIGAHHDYNLANNVAVNKFINYEGKKFSKSRGWIIDAAEIGNKYGTDIVRFYLARNSQENKEGNFTWEDFHATTNNELVGKVSNFVHRTLTFIANKLGGTIESDTIDPQVRSEIEATFKESSESIQKIEQVKGLDRIMELVDFANRYFDQQEVWNVVKTDPQKAQAILYNCSILIANLATLLHPFIPNFSIKARKMLNLEPLEYSVGNNQWQYTDPFDGKIIVTEKIEPIFLRTEGKI